MKDYYIIINLENMDYFKDSQNKIIYFKTYTEALNTCGIYEFDNVWILKLEYNYKEDD